MGWLDETQKELEQQKKKAETRSRKAKIEAELKAKRRAKNLEYSIKTYDLLVRNLLYDVGHVVFGKQWFGLVNNFSVRTIKHESGFIFTSYYDWYYGHEVFTRDFYGWELYGCEYSTGKHYVIEINLDKDNLATSFTVTVGPPDFIYRDVEKINHLGINLSEVQEINLSEVALKEALKKIIISTSK